jgi:hypothetical protein
MATLVLRHIAERMAETGVLLGAARDRHTSVDPTCAGTIRPSIVTPP